MDQNTRTMFRIIAWVSFLTIVVVVAYGLIESFRNFRTGLAVGEVLVDVYWPLPPYFAQPVTYFSVACVSLFYSGLRLWEIRISRWPGWLLSFLQMTGFVVAFSSAFEVLYNFMLWGATYSVAALTSHFPNPDALFSSYPAPWSFVFATRAFAALFVISGYSVYFLRRLSNSLLI
ncbi:MAG: hypothetical protein HY297_00790 [Thaumarchaeota archaeon]|nr:hypothetical protein [Nitrososphaerota archaeon]